MTIQLIDQLDTQGNPMNMDFSNVDVVQLGNSLRDKTTGMCWAIKDEYGDWVSPTMHKVGVKSVIIVEDTDEDRQEHPDG